MPPSCHSVFCKTRKLAVSFRESQQLLRNAIGALMFAVAACTQSDVHNLRKFLNDKILEAVKQLTHAVAADGGGAPVLAIVPWREVTLLTTGGAATMVNKLSAADNVSGDTKAVYRATWHGRTCAVLVSLTGVKLPSLEVAMMVQFSQWPWLPTVYGLCEDVPTGSGSTTAHGLLTEWAECGNARDYVHGLSQARVTPSPRVLLTIAQHAAEAMVLVCQGGYLHNDIAARNVLLMSCPKDGKDATQVAAMLTDFGLAKKNKVGLYGTKGADSLPERWSAPEVLETGSYSIESDAWAFGVLLWELFSEGKLPHYMLGAADVRKGVINGTARLAQPASMPDGVWALAQRCMLNAREARPSFPDIRSEIVRLLDVEM